MPDVTCCRGGLQEGNYEDVNYELQMRVRNELNGSARRLDLISWPISLYIEPPLEKMEVLC